MVKTRWAKPGMLGIGLLALSGALACSSPASTASGASGGTTQTATGLGVIIEADGAIIEPDGAVIDTDGDTISCLNDPRAEAYVPNMTQPGSGGLLTFTLESASPAPPALGNANMWMLQVKDQSGQPVPDATFSLISTWMPDHGHGSTPGIATSNGNGTYAISNLYFFMPGIWQITFNAQVASASDAAPTSDYATFTFCVGG